jgi:hypothetical protein
LVHPFPFLSSFEIQKQKTWIVEECLLNSCLFWILRIEELPNFQFENFKSFIEDYWNHYLNYFDINLFYKNRFLIIAIPSIFLCTLKLAKSFNLFLNYYFMSFININLMYLIRLNSVLLHFKNSGINYLNFHLLYYLFKKKIDFLISYH